MKVKLSLSVFVALIITFAVITFSQAAPRQVVNVAYHVCSYNAFKRCATATPTRKPTATRTTTAVPTKAITVTPRITPTRFCYFVGLTQSQPALYIWNCEGVVKILYPNQTPS